MSEHKSTSVLVGGCRAIPTASTLTTHVRTSAVMNLWQPAPKSVGAVRRFLARYLIACGLSDLTDAAELVLSELFTNAVMHAFPSHGRRLIETRFEHSGDGVRIEVHDPSDRMPELGEAAADAQCGRGLVLVNELTGGHWGVCKRGSGKVVWAVCADGGSAAAE